MNHAEREPRHNESAVRALAAIQFGLVTDRQARDRGVSGAAISRRVQSELWQRVLPRVYRISGVPPSGRQAAMAAALWAGEGALVSHHTAAAIWGFDVTGMRKVELWVPSSRSMRSSLVVAHRGERLDRADRAVVDGIPITTPVRTLIDIAGRIEDEQLLALTEELVRRRVVSEDRLHARLQALRSAGRPGAGRLMTLLEARGSGPALESRLEVRVWRLLRSSGLPVPIRQHRVVAEGCRYRLDFAWPDRMVAVECDGWLAHGGQGAFNEDRIRLGGLVASGWRVIPVTWRECSSEPARVVRRVMAALSRAA